MIFKKLIHFNQFTLLFKQLNNKNNFGRLVNFLIKHIHNKKKDWINKFYNNMIIYICRLFYDLYLFLFSHIYSISLALNSRKNLFYRKIK